MKKKHTGIIGAALIVAGTLTAATFDKKINKSDGCGGSERWAVKILRDYYVDKVDLNHPIHKTIADLNQLKTFDARKVNVRQPLEYKSYEVECTIEKKISENDKDYHLVLYGLDGKSHMIGEVPDPNCSRTEKSKLVDNFSEVRDFVDSYHGHFDGKKFKIKGVAFVDFEHGQTGHADNNLELHPIFSIEEE